MREKEKRRLKKKNENRRRDNKRGGNAKKTLWRRYERRTLRKKIPLAHKGRLRGERIKATLVALYVETKGEGGGANLADSKKEATTTARQRRSEGRVGKAPGWVGLGLGIRA